jgi:hypothetical protein
MYVRWTFYQEQVYGTLSPAADRESRMNVNNMILVYRRRAVYFYSFLYFKCTAELSVYYYYIADWTLFLSKLSIILV